MYEVDTISAARGEFNYWNYRLAHLSLASNASSDELKDAVSNLLIARQRLDQFIDDQIKLNMEGFRG